MATSRSSVLKIGGAIIGLLLEALYFLYPSEMTSTIRTWLGVTDATIVAWIMEGILLTGAVTLVLVIAVTVWQHYGLQVVRKKAVKTTEPPSPRYVESGTPIIPNGRPIILTSQLLAGVDFYPSRKELPPIEDFLRTAKSSVDLLGFTLENIAVQNRETLRSLLKEHKHIRFILLNPRSELVGKVEGAVTSLTLGKSIERSLEELQELKDSLSNIDRGYLDIRTHDLLPMHTIVAIDGESEAGVMNVEYYVYGTDSRAWPSLRISRKLQTELFEKYWKSYKYVWDRSKSHLEQSAGSVKIFSG